MSSVLDVARYIVQLGGEHTVDGEYDLTPEAPEACLLCQGAHLAFYGKPLFPKPIEAWKHGPVCPSLYRALKPAGIHPVFELDAKDSLSESEKQLIADVCREYGRFAAWKLQDMTRKEAPWAAARINGTISQESMKTFLNRRTPSRAARSEGMNQDTVKEKLQSIHESPIEYAVMFSGKKSKRVNGSYKRATFVDAEGKQN
ncbi:MAG: DUF4065 domain-containing protein, partial [Treponema sp.]|nr:DUF4065 domain-containing protein [Treponema sp.]